MFWICQSWSKSIIYLRINTSYCCWSYWLNILWNLIKHRTNFYISSFRFFSRIGTHMFHFIKCTTHYFVSNCTSRNILSNWKLIQTWCSCNSTCIFYLYFCFLFWSMSFKTMILKTFFRFFFFLFLNTL